MKLYYSAGSCSLSPHIILKEAGLTFEAISAPTKTHTLPDGSDYYKINPLGYVPLLVLDDGRQLREGPAIVQYLADQVPEKNLAPANGTYERYKLQEWLNFIGTELHKGFGALFNAATPPAYKTMAIAQIAKRLAFVDGELAAKPYLMGNAFTVADAYLFTVTNWAQHVNVDLSAFTHVLALRARVAARPAVIAAMTAEGLLK
jgi:glutathione S-transferase